MYENMFSCEHWLYTYGVEEYGFARQSQRRAHSSCDQPQALGWLAALYFVVFVVIAAQVLLTLFIGSTTQLDFFNYN